MKRWIRHTLIKNTLLLRRNPHPIIFLIALIIILFPLTSVYENLEDWDIKVGVVNQDEGFDGIRYSVFLLSELNLDEVHFSSLNDAMEAGENGKVDAVIYIDANFSLVIHEMANGNMSKVANQTIMEIYVFSNYPQIKAALAAKMKVAYEKIANVGENGIVEYRDYSNYREFSYFSTTLLLSFIFTFYYTLLFLFKDSRGPFFWFYFRNRRGFLSMFLSHLIFFLPLSLILSLLISLLYHLPGSFTATILPLTLITLGSISLAFFLSTFLRRESTLYYSSPIVMLLGIIASGVMGPEKYMPIYLKLIYEAFPVSIEFFYSNSYVILRSILVSLLLLGYSAWYYLLRD